MYNITESCVQLLGLDVIKLMMKVLGYLVKLYSRTHSKVLFSLSKSLDPKDTAPPHVKAGYTRHNLELLDPAV